jgi:signal peptidase I
LSLSIVLVLVGPLATVVSIALFAILHVGSVTGTSMEPTLNHGDFVIALRRLPFMRIRRGSVVLVQPNQSGSGVWVKRVVAVSGEEYLTRIAEFSNPYLRETYRERFDADGKQVTRVPPDTVFIRGDSPGCN